MILPFLLCPLSRSWWTPSSSLHCCMRMWWWAMGAPSWEIFSSAQIISTCMLLPINRYCKPHVKTQNTKSTASPMQPIPAASNYGWLHIKSMIYLVCDRLWYIDTVVIKMIAALLHIGIICKMYKVSDVYNKIAGPARCLLTVTCDCMLKLLKLNQENYL